jgi:general secretion pathway protein K
MSGARRQRGIALLVALLTIALAAVLIAGLLDRGELALARTRNALRAEQAQAYAQGLEGYAARVLQKDLDEDPNNDSNTDIWAMPLPPQTVPGGVIRASMRDLNGCFNLNNLSLPNAGNPTWARMFQRLLDARGVDPTLLDAIQDWLGAPDANDENTIDAYYLAQPVPYRSAHRVFAHVSELRLVRGVTSDVYARLAPYVCALPKGSHINVNTASVPVLQTLGGISEAQAVSVWRNGQAQWTSNFVSTWSSQLGVIADPGAADKAGTTSYYFLARSDIDLDDVSFTFFSVIERRQGVGVRVIARSRGIDAAPATSGAPVVPSAPQH